MGMSGVRVLIGTLGSFHVRKKVDLSYSKALPLWDGFVLVLFVFLPVLRFVDLV